MNRLVACRPPAGRVETKKSSRPMPVAPTSGVVSGDVPSIAEVWASSSVAFAMSRGPCTATLSTPSLRPVLPRHAMVPFRFPVQVRRVAPRSPPSRTSAPCGGDPAPSETAHFLLPFGHRHSLLGHPIPAQELGLPHSRLTGPSGAGPGRGYHVPHPRDTTGLGASSTPGTAVLTPTGRRARPARAASQRPVPTPRHHHPPRGSA